MPPLLDQQLRRIIAGEGRRSALVLLGEARSRLQRIDLGEYRGARSERHRLAGYLARHLDEDAVHLGLLLVEQADEFVVLLDRLERLDIYGLAAAAGAVHHTRDAALELCLHRDDEALAANRDEVFLRRALAGEAAQRLAQAALDGALLPLDLAADAAQIGRGIVIQGAVRVDARPQRAQQRRKLVAAQRFGHRTQ